MGLVGRAENLVVGPVDGGEDVAIDRQGPAVDDGLASGRYCPLVLLHAPETEVVIRHARGPRRLNGGLSRPVAADPRVYLRSRLGGFDQSRAAPTER